MKIQYFRWTHQLLTVLIGVSLGACGGGGSPTVSAPDQVGTKLALVPEQEALPATVASTTLEADFGIPQSAEKIAAMAATVGTYFSGRSTQLAEVQSTNVKPIAMTKSAPYPQPVFRFFNTRAGVHFYTISSLERNSTVINLPWFQLEGVGFYAQPAPVTGLSAVYRFYNRITGTHFYTISETEKSDVLAKFSAIYSLDGPGLFASAAPATGWVPTHRFFNRATGTHFYTANESERQSVVAKNPEMQYDGIGYYVLQSSDEPTGPDAVDKYIGTWRGCVTFNGGSNLTVVSIGKTSPFGGTLSGADSDFKTSNCTGASTNEEAYSGVFTLAGTKTIGGKLVDKMVVKIAPDVLKRVYFVANDIFYFGDGEGFGATFDNEGFPNQLNVTGKIKQ